MKEARAINSDCPKPLAGVRVLDLTQIMAGPMCGAYLADLGADCIKVELPSGDSIRSPQNSLTIAACNRNKRGIVLDYKTPEGLQLLHRLIANSDVVLENSRPGVAERRGYGYEDVRQHNPRLIYCSISAFGRTGPYAHKPAVDWIVQGISGAMSWTGELGGDPVRIGPPLCDFAGAIMAAYGVLAALMARDATGVGRRVDISLLDSTLHVINQRLLEYPVNGHILEPMGTTHPWDAPHETFRTSDGLLNIGVQEEWRWHRFCEALGLGDLATDPRFATNTDRLANLSELREILAPLFRSQPTEHWLTVLEDAEQYVGKVQNLKEVWDDPQVAENGILAEVELPDGTTTRVVKSAVNLSDIDLNIVRRAPQLGEHTREVLTEFGIDADELSELEHRGVVKQAAS